MCDLHRQTSEIFTKSEGYTVTSPFIQNLNRIHKELWEEAEDGEVSGETIKRAIKKEAGRTVIDEYWKELHQYGRVEQVPDTQTWIVKQPEEAGINPDRQGEKRQKNILIPEDVLQAAEQYGVNFSAVTTQALIEEISNIEQFVEDYLGEDFTEQETEYIFELLKKRLHTKQGDRRQMARRDRRRRQLYENIFDEQPDNEHIENLRQKSFELQEMLEV